MSRAFNRICRLVAAVTLICFTSQTAFANILPTQGQVQNGSVPANGKNAILVLNAHTSSDAQKSISDLLKTYQAQGIDLIGLEGAGDKIDGQIFRSFPYKEALSQAAWEMVKEGTFTGAEHFYITAEKLPHFFGLEDKSVYFENRDAFLQTTEAANQLHDTLDVLNGKLLSLKKKNYSRQLFEFDQKMNRYQEHNLSYLEFIQILFLAAQKTRINLTNFSTLYVLFKAIEQEKKLSRKKVNELEKISAQIKALDSAQLFSESDRLAELIYERLSRNDKEKKLIQFSKSFGLFQKMISLQLTQKEWEQIQFSSPLVGKGFLVGLESFHIPASDLALIQSAAASARRFYELAEKRNHIFADRIEREMNRKKKDTSVIVIGGFHEKGLKTALQAKGISTTVISPKIGEALSDIPYMDRMLGKPTEFEASLIQASTLADMIKFSDLVSDKIKMNFFSVLSGRASIINGENGTFQIQVTYNGKPLAVNVTKNSDGTYVINSVESAVILSPSRHPEPFARHPDPERSEGEGSQGRLREGSKLLDSSAFGLRMTRILNSFTLAGPLFFASIYVASRAEARTMFTFEERQKIGKEYGINIAVLNGNAENPEELELTGYDLEKLTKARDQIIEKYPFYSDYRRGRVEWRNISSEGNKQLYILRLARPVQEPAPRRSEARTYPGAGENFPWVSAAFEAKLQKLYRDDKDFQAIETLLTEDISGDLVPQTPDERIKRNGHRANLVQKYLEIEKQISASDPQRDENSKPIFRRIHQKINVLRVVATAHELYEEWLPKWFWKWRLSGFNEAKNKVYRRLQKLHGFEAEYYGVDGQKVSIDQLVLQAMALLDRKHDFILRVDSTLYERPKRIILYPFELRAEGAEQVAKIISGVLWRNIDESNGQKKISVWYDSSVLVAGSIGVMGQEIGDFVIRNGQLLRFEQSKNSSEGQYVGFSDRDVRKSLADNLRLQQGWNEEAVYRVRTQVKDGQIFIFVSPSSRAEVRANLVDQVRKSFNPRVDPNLILVKNVEVVKTLNEATGPIGFYENQHELLHAHNVAAQRILRWKHDLGDKNKFTKDLGDGEATHWLRSYFNEAIAWLKGLVVIGEGERDEAPMLFIGERVGNQEYRDQLDAPHETDIALDVLELTNGIVKGNIKGSVSIGAYSNRGGLMHAPDIYISKWVVGPQAKGSGVSVEKKTKENLEAIAAKTGKNIADLKGAILFRPAHIRRIVELIESGIDTRGDPDLAALVHAFHEFDAARNKPSELPDAQKALDAIFKSLDKKIKAVGIYTAENLFLLADGDLTPAFGLKTGQIDFVTGRGGAPEGVLAATIVRAIGGEMSARFVSADALSEAAMHSDLDRDGARFSDKEKDRLRSFGFAEPGTSDLALKKGQQKWDHIYTAEELAPARDFTVIASAVKENPWVPGLEAPYLDFETGDLISFAVKASSSGHIEVLKVTYETIVASLRVEIEQLERTLAAFSSSDERVLMENIISNAYYQLGKNYLGYQFFDEAVKAFDTAIDHNPGEANYYRAAKQFALGFKTLILGIDKDGNKDINIFQTAQKYFEQSLELSRDNRDATLRVHPILLDLYEFQGDEAAKKKDYPNALKFYARRLNRQHSDALQTKVRKVETEMQRVTDGGLSRAEARNLDLNQQRLNALKALEVAYDFFGLDKQWEKIKTRISLIQTVLSDPHHPQWESALEQLEILKSELKLKELEAPITPKWVPITPRMDLVKDMRLQDERGNIFKVEMKKPVGLRELAMPIDFVEIPEDRPITEVVTLVPVSGRAKRQNKFRRDIKTWLYEIDVYKKLNEAERIIDEGLKSSSAQPSAVADRSEARNEKEFNVNQARQIYHEGLQTEEALKMAFVQLILGRFKNTGLSGDDQTPLAIAEQYLSGLEPRVAIDTINFYSDNATFQTEILPELLRMNRSSRSEARMQNMIPPEIQESIVFLEEYINNPSRSIVQPNPEMAGTLEAANRYTKERVNLKSPLRQIADLLRKGGLAPNSQEHGNLIKVAHKLLTPLRAEARLPDGQARAAVDRSQVRIVLFKDVQDQPDVAGGAHRRYYSEFASLGYETANEQIISTREGDAIGLLKARLNDPHGYPHLLILPPDLTENEATSIQNLLNELPHGTALHPGKKPVIVVLKNSMDTKHPFETQWVYGFHVSWAIGGAHYFPVADFETTRLFQATIKNKVEPVLSHRFPELKRRAEARSFEEGPLSDLIRTALQIRKNLEDNLIKKGSSEGQVTITADHLFAMIESLIKRVKEPLEGYRQLGMWELEKIKNPAKKRFIEFIMRLNHPQNARLDSQTGAAIKEFMETDLESLAVSRSEARKKDSSKFLVSSLKLGPLGLVNSKLETRNFELSSRRSEVRGMELEGMGTRNEKFNEYVFGSADPNRVKPNKKQGIKKRQAWQSSFPSFSSIINQNSYDQKNQPQTSKTNSDDKRKPFKKVTGETNSQNRLAQVRNISGDELNGQLIQPNHNSKTPPFPVAIRAGSGSIGVNSSKINENIYNYQYRSEARINNAANQVVDQIFDIFSSTESYSTNLEIRVFYSSLNEGQPQAQSIGEFTVVNGDLSLSRYSARKLLVGNLRSAPGWNPRAVYDVTAQEMNDRLTIVVSPRAEARKKERIAYSVEEIEKLSAKRYPLSPKFPRSEARASKEDEALVEAIEKLNPTVQTKEGMRDIRVLRAFWRIFKLLEGSPEGTLQVRSVELQRAIRKYYKHLDHLAKAEELFKEKGESSGDPLSDLLAMIFKRTTSEGPILHKKHPISQIRVLADIFSDYDVTDLKLTDQVIKNYLSDLFFRDKKGEFRNPWLVRLVREALTGQKPKYLSLDLKTKTLSLVSAYERRKHKALKRAIKILDDPVLQEKDYGRSTDRLWELVIEGFSDVIRDELSKHPAIKEIEETIDEIEGELGRSHRSEARVFRTVGKEEIIPISNFHAGFNFLVRRLKVITKHDSASGEMIVAIIPHWNVSGTAGHDKSLEIRTQGSIEEARELHYEVVAKIKAFKVLYREDDNEATKKIFRRLVYFYGKQDAYKISRARAEARMLERLSDRKDGFERHYRLKQEAFLVDIPSEIVKIENLESQADILKIEIIPVRQALNLQDKLIRLPAGTLLKVSLQFRSDQTDRRSEARKPWKKLDPQEEVVKFRGKELRNIALTNHEAIKDVVRFFQSIPDIHSLTMSQALHQPVPPLILLEQKQQRMNTGEVVLNTHSFDIRSFFGGQFSESVRHFQKTVIDHAILPLWMDGIGYLPLIQDPAKFIMTVYKLPPSASGSLYKIRIDLKQARSEARMLVLTREVNESIDIDNGRIVLKVTEIKRRPNTVQIEISTAGVTSFKTLDSDNPLTIDNIKIKALEFRGSNKVRIGITAPREIPVHRGEVAEAIRAQRRSEARNGEEIKSDAINNLQQVRGFLIVDSKPYESLLSAESLVEKDQYEDAYRIINEVRAKLSTEAWGESHPVIQNIKEALNSLNQLRRSEARDIDAQKKYELVSEAYRTKFDKLYFNDFAKIPEFLTRDIDGEPVPESDQARAERNRQRAYWSLDYLGTHSVMQYPLSASDPKSDPVTFEKVNREILRVINEILAPFEARSGAKKAAAQITEVAKASSVSHVLVYYLAAYNTGGAQAKQVEKFDVKEGSFSREGSPTVLVMLRKSIEENLLSASKLPETATYQITPNLKDGTMMIFVSPAPRSEARAFASLKRLEGRDSYRNYSLDSAAKVGGIPGAIIEIENQNGHVISEGSIVNILARPPNEKKSSLLDLQDKNKLLPKGTLLTASFRSEVRVEEHPEFLNTVLMALVDYLEFRPLDQTLFATGVVEEIHPRATLSERRLKNLYETIGMKPFTIRGTQSVKRSFDLILIPREKAVPLQPSDIEVPNTNFIVRITAKERVEPPPSIFGEEAKNIREQLKFFTVINRLTAEGKGELFERFLGTENFRYFKVLRDVREIYRKHKEGKGEVSDDQLILNDDRNDPMTFTLFEGRLSQILKVSDLGKDTKTVISELKKAVDQFIDLNDLVVELLVSALQRGDFSREDAKILLFLQQIGVGVVSEEVVRAVHEGAVYRDYGRYQYGFQFNPGRVKRGGFFATRKIGGMDETILSRSYINDYYPLQRYLPFQGPDLVEYREQANPFPHEPYSTNAVHDHIALQVPTVEDLESRLENLRHNVPSGERTRFRDFMNVAYSGFTIPHLHYQGFLKETNVEKALALPEALKLLAVDQRRDVKFYAVNKGAFGKDREQGFPLRSTIVVEGKGPLATAEATIEVLRNANEDRSLVLGPKSKFTYNLFLTYDGQNFRVFIFVKHLYKNPFLDNPNKPTFLFEPEVIVYTNEKKLMKEANQLRDLIHKALDGKSQEIITELNALGIKQSLIDKAAQGAHRDVVAGLTAYGFKKGLILYSGRPAGVEIVDTLIFGHPDHKDAFEKIKKSRALQDYVIKEIFKQVAYENFSELVAAITRDFASRSEARSSGFLNQISTVVNDEKNINAAWLAANVRLEMENKPPLGPEDEPKILKRVQYQSAKAEAPLSEALNRLRMAGHKNVAAMIEDLYLKALPYYIKGQDVSPIHHIAHVMNLLSEILLGESGIEPWEIKVTMLAALFHDIGNGDTVLPKIRASDVKKIENPDERKEKRDKAIAFREEHVEKGLRIVDLILKKYRTLHPRALTAKQIEKLKEIIYRHDHPTIAQLQSELGEKVDKTYLISWRKTDRLLSFHREADRMWMLTEDGIEVDLKGKTSGWDVQLANNLDRHREEAKLYADPRNFEKYGFKRGLLYRSRTADEMVTRLTAPFMERERKHWINMLKTGEEAINLVKFSLLGQDQYGQIDKTLGLIRKVRETEETFGSLSPEEIEEIKTFLNLVNEALQSSHKDRLEQAESSARSAKSSTWTEYEPGRWHNFGRFYERKALGYRADAETIQRVQTLIQELTGSFESRKNGVVSTEGIRSEFVYVLEYLIPTISFQIARLSGWVVDQQKKARDMIIEIKNRVDKGSPIDEKELTETIRLINEAKFTPGQHTNEGGDYWKEWDDLNGSFDQAIAIMESIQTSPRSEARETDKRLELLQSMGYEVMGEVQKSDWRIISFLIDSELMPSGPQEWLKADRLYTGMTKSNYAPYLIRLPYVNLRSAPVDSDIREDLDLIMQDRGLVIQGLMRGIHPEDEPMQEFLYPYADQEVLTIRDELQAIQDLDFEKLTQLIVSQGFDTEKRLRKSIAHIRARETSKEALRNVVFRSLVRKLIAFLNEPQAIQPEDKPKLDSLIRNLIPNSFVTFRYTSDYGSKDELVAFFNALDEVRKSKQFRRDTTVVFTFLNPDTIYRDVWGRSLKLHQELYRILRNDGKINFYDFHDRKKPPNFPRTLKPHAITVINLPKLESSLFNHLYAYSDLAVLAGDKGLNNAIVLAKHRLGPITFFQPHPHSTQAMKSQVRRRIEDKIKPNSAYFQLREEALKVFDLYLDVQSPLTPVPRREVEEVLRRVMSRGSETEAYQFVLGQLVEEGNMFNLLAEIVRDLDEGIALQEIRTNPPKVSGFEIKGDPLELKDHRIVVQLLQAVTGLGDVRFISQIAETFRSFGVSAQDVLIHLADENINVLRTGLEHLEFATDAEKLRFLFVDQEGRHLLLKKERVARPAVISTPVRSEVRVANEAELSNTDVARRLIATISAPEDNRERGKAAARLLQIGKDEPRALSLAVEDLRKSLANTESPVLLMIKALEYMSEHRPDHMRLTTLFRGNEHIRSQRRVMYALLLDMLREVGVFDVVLVQDGKVTPELEAYQMELKSRQVTLTAGEVIVAGTDINRDNYDHVATLIGDFIQEKAPRQRAGIQAPVYSSIWGEGYSSFKVVMPPQKYRAETRQIPDSVKEAVRNLGFGLSEDKINGFKTIEDLANFAGGKAAESIRMNYDQNMQTFSRREEPEVAKQQALATVKIDVQNIILPGEPENISPQDLKQFSDITQLTNFFSQEVVRRIETAATPRRAEARSLESLIDPALLNQEQRNVYDLLINLDQGHLFERWLPAGQDVDAKIDFFDDVIHFNRTNPHGSLAKYITQGIKLLQNAKTGNDPLKQARMEPAEGVNLKGLDTEYLALEKEGLRAANTLGFALVAGGLGERLKKDWSQGLPKVEIPVSLITGMTHLEKDIRTIDAYVQKSNQVKGEKKAGQFFIMTSDETHEGIQKLLSKLGFRKVTKTYQIENLPKEREVYISSKYKVEIRLAKQEVVPAFKDNSGHFVTEQDNPYKLIAKPHGHGDVHSLMHSTGTAEDWKAMGIKHTIFFQDTNAPVVNAILPGLGLTIRNHFGINYFTTARELNEAMGMIMQVTYPEERRVTRNIEYSYITQSVVKEKPDATGKSIYPGNMNVFIVAQIEYTDLLRQTGGVMAELINPKYTDAAKEIFPPARPETQMQDLTESPAAKDIKVGVTRFAQKRFWFAPTKNDDGSGVSEIQAGKNPDTMDYTETVWYWSHRKVLSEIAGVKIQVNPTIPGPIGLFVDEDPARPEAFKDNLPAVEWDRRFAATVDQVKGKFNNVEINNGSVLSISGENVRLENVKLKGALIVNVPQGSSLTIQNVTIQNEGHKFVKLNAAELVDLEVPEALRSRHYKVINQDQTLVLDLTGQMPGNYVYDKDGLWEKVVEDYPNWLASDIEANNRRRYAEKLLEPIVPTSAKTNGSQRAEIRKGNFESPVQRPELVESETPIRSVIPKPHEKAFEVAIGGLTIQTGKIDFEFQETLAADQISQNHESTTLFIRLSEDSVGQLSSISDINTVQKSTDQFFSTFKTVAGLHVPVTFVVGSKEEKKDLRQAIERYEPGLSARLTVQYFENGIPLAQRMNQVKTGTVYYLTDIEEAKVMVSKAFETNFVATDEFITGNENTNAPARLAGIAAALIRQIKDQFQVSLDNPRIFIPSASVFVNLNEQLAVFKRAANRLLSAA